MRFKDLRMLSNARYYDLEVYGRDGDMRMIPTLDAENRVDKQSLAVYADAEVVRFQPIINDDGFPALEVELNV